MPGREVPDLILLLQPTVLQCGIHVYAVGFDGGKIISKKLLTMEWEFSHSFGFAVSGTKLFRVGGRGRNSPRDVKIWDLSDWRNRNENDFPVDCGQTLAAKPRPVVFEYDGKIYALSGIEFPVNQKPDPAFEVFDPTTICWYGLSYPPFIAEYKKGYCPFIERHTVIGKTLYVSIRNCALEAENRSWEYYAYSIPSDTWAAITNDFANVFDSRAINFMKHCRLLRYINHVDENTIVFACNSRMEVYACELNSDVDELSARPSLKKPKFSTDCAAVDRDASSVSVESNSSDSDDMIDDDHPFKYLRMALDSADEYNPPEMDLSAFLHVHGFGAKDFREWFSNHQMVVHLTSDIYALVYLYVQSRKENDQMIRVTIFQALKKSTEEKVIEAKILDISSFKADFVMIPEAWCKFKSKV